MHDKVDVLIIGSGASGATVAWSLADTNMRIVCLEQGDWVRPNHDLSNRRVWESHRYGDFAAIPIRRDLPADYPINDDGSPIKFANVNGVGGSTVMCMGHFSSPASVGFQSTSPGRRRRRLAHRLRYAGAVLRRE